MTSKEENQRGAGCLVIIGIIIASLALGSLFGTAYGWLFLGITLLALGLLAGWEQRN